MARRNTEVINPTQKRLEDLLQESEDRFRLLADAAPMLVWMTDEKGDCNYCNSHKLELTGLPLSAHLGKGWTDCIHPEDQHKSYNNYLAKFNAHSQFQMEYRLRCVGGKYCWILDTGVPRFSAEGEFLGYINTGIDITQQKEALAALKKTQNLVEAVIENFSFPVWVKDISGNYLLVNSAAAQFWEIIENNEQAIFSGKLASKLRDKEHQVINHRQSQEFTEIISINGVEKPYTITIKPWYDELGNVLGIIGISQEDQQPIEKSTILLNTIIDSLPETFYVKDIQGRYVLINSAGAKGVGKSVEDFLGKDDTEIFPLEFASQLTENDRKIMTSGAGQILEETLENGDSKQIFLSRKSVWKDSQGNIIGLVGFTQDITAQKIQEAALKESEERFRAILEQAAVGIAANSLTGKILWINQKLGDLVGYTKEEMLALTYQEITHPDDWEGDQEFIAKALAGESVKSREKRYIRQDGTTIWVNLTVSIVRDSEGVPKYTISVVEDISDRKALEQELALRQARFDAFFSAAPVGLLILDEQLRFVQINEKLAEMGGVPVADSLGKTFWDIVPDLAPTLDPMCRGILATGIPVLNGEISGEIPYQPGVERHWMTSYFPLPGDAGNILGIGAVIVEITERKQAEKALSESLERFQLVSQVSWDGIWDARYIWQDGVIPKEEVYYSPRLQELVGFQEWEFKNTTVSYFSRIHPEDRDRTIHALNAHLSDRVPYQDVEYRILTSNGEYRWVCARGKSIWDEKGRVERFIGSIRDITERKEAEKALRKTEELYRTLIEHFPNGSVFLFDQDRRFLVTGGSSLSQAGFSPADLEGKTPWEIWSPEEYHSFDKFYQAALAGEVIKDERSYENLTYQIQAVPVRNPSGEIFGGLLILQNITERKQAEQAIEESANRLELLNRIAGQIRASLDLDTILETVVTSIRELFEIDACTFVWYLTDNSLGSDNETFLGSLNNSVNSGQTETAIWQAVKEARDPSLPSFLGIYPDSVIKPIAVKTWQQETIIVDDIEAVSDPTLKQLLQSFNCLSLLTVPFQTNGGKVGFLSCSNHRGKKAWKESEIELILGIADNLAIAISQAELYHNSQNSAKIASERALQLEKALQDLQRTQTQLIQSEKMSSLGQLVAGVAHEINNPVSFIYGNISPAQQYITDLLDLIELYQLEYPQPTPSIQSQIELIDLDFLIEDLPKLLESMKVGSERIREIVLSLRNFSRMDEAQIKDVCIHEGIDSTLRLLQNRLKAKPDHPEILVVKNYEKLPLVECYAGQLNQVFMNLLTNAIDALDERDKKRSIADIKANPSQINITTSVVNSEQIAITIADNGLGMSEVVQARIFDPFFTTKPVGKGTGLGLAISYQVVVEKHLGSLRCHSVPGEGTTFIVKIPIKLSAKTQS